MAEKPEQMFITPVSKNFIGQLVLIAVLLGAVSFMFLGIARYIGFMLPGGVMMASLIAIVFLAVIVLMFVFPIMENLFTQKLIIDENEIVFKKGIFTKKLTVIPRHFVFSVEVAQNPYQSLVGTADISIVSGGYACIGFKGISLAEAERVKKAIC